MAGFSHALGLWHTLPRINWTVLFCIYTTQVSHGMVAAVYLCKNLKRQTQVILVPKRGKMVVKAKERAKAQEYLKLDYASIGATIIKQKRGTFLTADHYHSRNESLIPIKGSAITNDIRNRSSG